MEQNGASNGEDAKPESSPPASGKGKGTGTKRRRKVNHGTSSRPGFDALSETIATMADLGTCSCSLCVLSTICKYCIGWKYKRDTWVDAPMRRLFGRS